MCVVSVRAGLRVRAQLAELRPPRLPALAACLQPLRLAQQLGHSLAAAVPPDWSTRCGLPLPAFLNTFPFMFVPSPPFQITVSSKTTCITKGCICAYVSVCRLSLRVFLLYIVVMLCLCLRTCAGSPPPRAPAWRQSSSLYPPSATKTSPSTPHRQVKPRHRVCFGGSTFDSNCLLIILPRQARDKQKGTTQDVSVNPAPTGRGEHGDAEAREEASLGYGLTATVSEALTSQVRKRAF